MKRAVSVLAIMTVAGLLVGSAISAHAAWQRLEPGSDAPDFHLTDVVSGEAVSRDQFAGRKALLVMFVCRHCPYVQHVVDGLARFAKDYAGQDLGIVAISSNDPDAYPDDAPASLKEMAEGAGWVFPLGFDERQEAAKAYGVGFTPDFLLFDKDRRLVYHGQFDGSRPGNGKPVTGEDLRAAVDAVLEDRAAPSVQKPSFGCSIKWKPGRAPSE